MLEYTRLEALSVDVCLLPVRMTREVLEALRRLSPWVGREGKWARWSFPSPGVEVTVYAPETLEEEQHRLCRVMQHELRDGQRERKTLRILLKTGHPEPPALTLDPPEWIATLMAHTPAGELWAALLNSMPRVNANDPEARKALEPWLALRHQGPRRKILVNTDV